MMAKTLLIRVGKLTAAVWLKLFFASTMEQPDQPQRLFYYGDHPEDSSGGAITTYIGSSDQMAFADAEAVKPDELEECWEKLGECWKCNQYNYLTTFGDLARR